MADATQTEHADGPDPDDADPADPDAPLPGEEVSAAIDAAFDMLTITKLHAADSKRLKELFEVVHAFMPGYLPTAENEPVNWDCFPFGTRKALADMLCRCLKAIGEIADGGSLVAMYLGREAS